MATCRLKENERAELLITGSGQSQPSVSAVAHFAECQSCADAWKLQSSLWTAFDAWEMPPISSSFNRELYARIDAELATPWYERWAAAIKPVFGRPSFALAMVMAVIGVGLVVDHPVAKISPRQQSEVSAIQSAPARVSKTEADQVEKTLDDMEMLRQFDLGSEEKESAAKSM